MDAPLETEIDGIPVPWQLQPDCAIDDMSLFNWWRSGIGFNCQSIPDRDLDLYGDLVGRHVSDAFTALSFHLGGKWVHLTYQVLHERVLAQQTAFARYPIEPQQSIVIATRDPLDRLVGMLAALRAGLTPTILIPEGSTRLRMELEWVNPDWVDADRDLLQWLSEDWKSRCLLPANGPILRPIESVKLTPSAIAFRWIDPYNPGPEGILDVAAGSLFNSLLRDSALVLGLRRGDTLATIRSCHRLVPFIELVVLFAGATFMSLDAEATDELRRTLLEDPLTVVSLPLEIAEAIAARPVDTAPQWGRWYRDALEVPMINRWVAAVEALKLQGLPSAALHWSLQSGTVVLGTPWTNTPIDLDMFPACGVPWQLGDLMAPESEAKLGFGRYCQLTGPKDDPVIQATPLMITRMSGQALRVVGTYPRGCSRGVYPTAQAIQALSMEGTWQIVVEEEAASDSNRPVRYILLCFMDPRSPEALQTVLEREVGLDALPDAICRLNMMPRFTEEGDLDAPWIQRQYLNGELLRRQAHPLYQALSRYKLELFNALNNPTSTSSLAQKGDS